ncbi:MAG: M67 family metallopeptidase [Chloroflexi bacterium]|jgi:[CysO sulfur-carrier protein]-S-L-cysteine hydrolase|nr:M67 family metallopeptidase [Chloroflexota bacterium]MBT4074118.1 M67 family metallopeptidase [Chloroflexota bacterium]MBT4514334.1 M67 family metallopeptidase [Chloroflexota bacterium]MBT5319613.1 M67 family metallopeptidase [Chloroflexota bacterium]MBT6682742.1 M67 family metallopeptidase [Chloroflexota bacterium]
MNSSPLRLPKSLLAEMISHALDADPEECCGVLLGRGDEATRLRRIRNVHESRVNRYSMDPLDLIEAERDADGRSEEFVAIYHSHTYSQGYPSDTDVRNAVESGWTGPYYVLVSLVEKTRPVVRAYRISEDGDVVEQFIRVLGVGGYTSGTTPPEVVD